MKKRVIRLILAGLVLFLAAVVIFGLPPRLPPAIRVYHPGAGRPANVRCPACQAALWAGDPDTLPYIEPEASESPAERYDRLRREIGKYGVYTPFKPTFSKPRP